MSRKRNPSSSESAVFDINQADADAIAEETAYSNGEKAPPPPTDSPAIGAESNGLVKRKPKYSRYMLLARSKVDGTVQMLCDEANGSRFRKWLKVAERMLRASYDQLRVLKCRDVTAQEIGDNA